MIDEMLHHGGNGQDEYDHRVGGFEHPRHAVGPPVGSSRRSAPAPAPGTDYDIESFIDFHALDEKCSEVLRSQTPEVQAYVIDQGPPEGRNTSAMVMGRIQKVCKELGSSQGGAGGGRFSNEPTLADVIEDFGRDHGLDEKC